MRVTSFHPLVAAALITAGACGQTGRTPRGSGPQGLPRPSELPSQGSVPGAMSPTPTTPTTTAARKRVDAKEEPATLVAADRTRCMVTADRFRDTRVGDTTICDWKSSDRAP